MKVLIINSHYNKGGAARIAGYIHNGLEDSGIEVKTIYGRGDDSDNPNIIRIDTKKEVYASVFGARTSGKIGWQNKLATQKAIEIIEGWKPDVIHLHNIHGYFINIPMLFECIVKNNIKVVWTLHDCFAFTGKCGYHFDCNKWINGCGKCPNLKGYPNTLVDKTAWLWETKKRLFNEVEDMTIVSPSDWLTNEAKESFLGKYECVTVRNGIDTENIFYPRDEIKVRQKYGFNDTDKIVLGIAVGYADPRKGAKYIIGLAEYLRDRAKVVLVGWDKKNNDMIKGLDNVITVPAIKKANVLAEYYSMADVFVIPSLAENYATTTLEAMSCGTPVVGFKSGGIPEQITEGRGMCVSSGNQEEFNEAVVELINNRDNFMPSHDLHESIVSDNSIGKMIDNYLDIYNN